MLGHVRGSMMAAPRRRSTSMASAMTFALVRVQPAARILQARRR